MGRGGAYVEYFVFMENTYGRSVIDELRVLRHQAIKLTINQLDEIRDKYLAKYKELLESDTINLS